VLGDGTRIPPTGWQRRGDSFVQAETGFALDSAGGLRPAGASSADAESDAESEATEYTVTADMFGLYLHPASGAPQPRPIHIPVSMLVEPSVASSG
jgi:hypothetical protein